MIGIDRALIDLDDLSAVIDQKGGWKAEVAMAIKRFLAVLEPMLILGLAVLIGGIVFSILLGVMGMSELVS